MKTVNAEMLIETLEAIINNRWVLYKTYKDAGGEANAQTEITEMCCYIECLNMIRDAEYLTRLHNIYCPAKEATSDE